MLNSRKVGTFKDVSFEYGGTLVDIGFMCKEERLALASELLSDIMCLIHSDFNNDREFEQFIKENT